MRQSVLIEVGVRGEINPHEDRLVKSYVEKEFADILEVDQVAIKTLSPIRTFWEKITLLHAENNRPVEKNPGDRMSRHYYDVYQLLKTSLPEEALNDLTLLYDVINNKKTYFKSSWANYDTAIPGTLKIFPNDRLLKYLQADYKNMALMIFGKIPVFDTILSTIREFESRFNQIKTI